MSLQSALVRIRAELETLNAILDKKRPKRLGNSFEAKRKRLIEHVQREPAIRVAIDDACRERIAGRPWPKMDWWTATFVWDRLYEAELFGLWMCAHGFYAADRTQTEILDILLIAHWTDLGMIRLKSRVDDFGSSSGQAHGIPPRI